MVLVAHRGDIAHCPANTLEGIASADAAITELVIHEYFDPPLAAADVDGWLTDAAHIPNPHFVAAHRYDIYA